MNNKTRLLLLAALFVLALPLIFTGTASAKYMSDGAVPDGVGGWKAPTDGICVIGLHSDGTMDVNASITTKRDCDAYTAGLSGMTTAGMCATTGVAGNDGAKHAWGGSSTCINASTKAGISMANLDRTAAMCTALGGVLANDTTSNPQGGVCTAYGWQYRGQDANGNPLAIGTKGTDAATAGYCYATMDWTSVYATAACPSLGATAAPFNANAAYDWSVASSQCRYGKSIAGKLTAALANTSGTTVAAAGTFVDFSTGTGLPGGTPITTMGQCLAIGGSWANWIGTAAAVTATGADTNTYKRPNWDYTRQAPDADNGCLHCHSYTSQQNGPAERFKDSYLKTGHKNMLRKVTAGQAWAGPDINGNMVNYENTGWASGTLDWGTATASNGTWTYPLLYIFGDWMAPAPGGLDIVVAVGGTAAKYNGGSDYSCAACHTAGWGNNSATAGLCTLSSKTTSATCTGAGGTWTPITGVQAIGTPGYAGTQPGDSFPGISFGAAGQWDLEGIQCSRCHNAAVGPVGTAAIAASSFHDTQPTSGGMGALANGQLRNNLCFGCHQSIAKTGLGTGADADLGNPAANIPTKNLATAPAYTPAFSGHIIGNQFLNSVHARWTGTIAPNSLGKYDLVGTGTYDSKFSGFTCWQTTNGNSPAKTKADGSEIASKSDCETLYGVGAWRRDVGTPNTANLDASYTYNAAQPPSFNSALVNTSNTQGTCTTCHDVHNSLFVAGQEGLRKECGDCHTDHVTTGGSAKLKFPIMSGVGCEGCHMPIPAAGDFPMHVWRINTDPNYSTFPTAAQFFSNTQRSANTYNDTDSTSGTYQAVAVDLSLACLRCHNGTDVFQFSGATVQDQKVTAAMLAAGMHSAAVDPATVPTASFTWAPDATTGLKVNFTSTSTCPSGGSCTYAWTASDATVIAAGSPTSGTFATNAVVNVTLTVTDSTHSTSASASQAVIPVQKLVVPTGSCVMGTTSGYGQPITLTFTGGTAYVDWGDMTGLDSAINNGTPTTHNYTKTGKFYIKYVVKSAEGLQKAGICNTGSPLPAPVIIPSGAGAGTFNVTGTISSTTYGPLKNVAVKVTDGTVTKLVFTDASGVYNVTVPISTNPYTLTPTLGGAGGLYTFAPVAPATGTIAVVAQTGTVTASFTATP